MTVRVCPQKAVIELSKYEPLWKYLESHGEQQVRLSFGEIKEILGFEIDHSFLTYKKKPRSLAIKSEKSLSRRNM